MNHDQARTILLGLAENADPNDRKKALQTVMDLREPMPETVRAVVPMSRGQQFEVVLPTPLTEYEWIYIRSVLDAMHDGIVTAPAVRPEAADPAGESTS